MNPAVDSTDSNGEVAGEHSEKVHYIITYKTDKDDEDEDNYLEKEFYRDNYLHNLDINGLNLKLVKGCPEVDDESEKVVNYVLIETPLEVFFDIAEKLKLKLPIAYNDLHVNESYSKMNKFFDCFTPEELKAENGRRYFTAPYEAKFHDKFLEFFGDKYESDILPEKFFLEVTHEILSRTTFSRRLTKPELFNDNEEDQRIGIDLLLANGVLKSCYPLHENYGQRNDLEKTTRQLLWDHWAKPWSLLVYQPLHLIRLYFGEKLAFYFSWLGFYTAWLIFPSIAGLLVVAYGYLSMGADIPISDICDASVNGTGSTVMCPLCYYDASCKTWELHQTCFYAKFTYLIDNYATVIFSIFVSIWNIMFTEFWQREQYKLQFKWDTLCYSKKHESIRPEFELQAKQKRINPISGENEPYVPPVDRCKRYSFSIVMTAFWVCLVLAAVLGVIVYRMSLMIVLSNSERLRHYSVSIVSISAGIINLIAIIILSNLYSWLAVKLTDMELHRTNSSYENSLTIKMYLFQFVNFYASIFYIAFFKGRYTILFDYLEPCEQSGCLAELCINLAIVMGGNVAYNIIEVLDPLIRNHFKQKKVKECKKRTTEDNTKSEEDTKSNKLDRLLYKEGLSWETDYNLNTWTNWSLFDEYLEIVIQYGFIAMFVVAFPLGPLLSLLSNIFEIRIDAFKALTQMRRPLPSRAKDIGIWLPILNTISKIGIITSGSIIAFTSDFIPRMVYSTQTGSLEGYVASTLSTKYIANITNKFERNALVALNITECKYRDFSDQTHIKYDYSLYEYQVLLARIVFLFIYEHFVFFLVAVVQRAIKNVPGYIQDQIEREMIIAQKTVWSTESESLRFYKRAKSNDRKISKKIFRDKDPTEFVQRL